MATWPTREPPPWAMANAAKLSQFEGQVLHAARAERRRRAAKTRGQPRRKEDVLTEYMKLSKLEILKQLPHAAARGGHGVASMTPVATAPRTTAASPAPPPPHETHHPRPRPLHKDEEHHLAIQALEDAIREDQASLRALVDATHPTLSHGATPAWVRPAGSPSLATNGYGYSHGYSYDGSADGFRAFSASSSPLALGSGPASSRGRYPHGTRPGGPGVSPVTAVATTALIEPLPARGDEGASVLSPAAHDRVVRVLLEDITTPAARGGAGTAAVGSPSVGTPAFWGDMSSPGRAAEGVSSIGPLDTVDGDGDDAPEAALIQLTRNWDRYIGDTTATAQLSSEFPREYTSDNVLPLRADVLERVRRGVWTGVKGTPTGPRIIPKACVTAAAAAPTTDDDHAPTPCVCACDAAAAPVVLHSTSGRDEATAAAATSTTLRHDLTRLCREKPDTAFDELLDNLPFAEAAAARAAADDAQAATASKGYAIPHGGVCAPALLCAAIDAVWQEYADALPLATVATQIEPSHVGLFLLYLFTTGDHSTLLGAPPGSLPSFILPLRRAVQAVAAARPDAGGADGGPVADAWAVLRKWVKCLAALDALCAIAPATLAARPGAAAVDAPAGATCRAAGPLALPCVVSLAGSDAGASDDSPLGGAGAFRLPWTASEAGAAWGVVPMFTSFPGCTRVMPPPRGNDDPTAMLDITRTDSMLMLDGAAHAAVVRPTTALPEGLPISGPIHAASAASVSASALFELSPEQVAGASPLTGVALSSVDVDLGLSDGRGDGGSRTDAAGSAWRAQGAVEGALADAAMRAAQRVVIEWEDRAPALPPGACWPLSHTQEAALTAHRQLPVTRGFIAETVSLAADRHRMGFLAQLKQLAAQDAGDVVDELCRNLSLRAQSTACVPAILARLCLRRSEGLAAVAAPAEVGGTSLFTSFPSLRQIRSTETVAQRAAAWARMTPAGFVQMVVDLLRLRDPDDVNRYLAGEGALTTPPIVEIEAALTAAALAHDPSARASAMRCVRKWAKTILLLLAYSEALPGAAVRHASGDAAAGSVVVAAAAALAAAAEAEATADHSPISARGPARRLFHTPQQTPRKRSSRTGRVWSKHLSSTASPMTRGKRASGSAAAAWRGGGDVSDVLGYGDDDDDDDDDAVGGGVVSALWAAPVFCIGEAGDGGGDGGGADGSAHATPRNASAGTARRHDLAQRNLLPFQNAPHAHAPQPSGTALPVGQQVFQFVLHGARGVKVAPFQGGVTDAGQATSPPAPSGDIESGNGGLGIGIGVAEPTATPIYLLAPCLEVRVAHVDGAVVTLDCVDTLDNAAVWHSAKKDVSWAVRRLQRFGEAEASWWDAVGTIVDDESVSRRHTAAVEALTSTACWEKYLYAARAALDVAARARLLLDRLNHAADIDLKLAWFRRYQGLMNDIARGGVDLSDAETASRCGLRLQLLPLEEEEARRAAIAAPHALHAALWAAELDAMREFAVGGDTAVLYCETLHLLCNEAAARWWIEEAMLVESEALLRAMMAFIATATRACEAIAFAGETGALAIIEMEDVVYTAEVGAMQEGINRIHEDERAAFFYDEAYRRWAIDEDAQTTAAVLHVDLLASATRSDVAALEIDAFAALAEAAVLEDEALRRALFTDAYAKTLLLAELEYHAARGIHEIWCEYASANEVTQIRLACTVAVELTLRGEWDAAYASWAARAAVEAEVLATVAGVWRAWQESVASDALEWAAACSESMHDLARVEAQQRAAVAEEQALLTQYYREVHKIALDAIIWHETNCLHEAQARCGTDEVGVFLPSPAGDPAGIHGDGEHLQKSGSIRQPVEAVHAAMWCFDTSAAAVADDLATSLGNAFQQKRGGLLEELIDNLAPWGVTLPHIRRGVEMVWFAYGLSTAAPVTPLSFFLAWVMAAPAYTLERVLLDDACARGSVNAGALSIQDELFVALGGEDVVRAKLGGGGAGGEDLFPPGASPMLVRWKWAHTACTILAAQRVLFEAEALSPCRISIGEATPAPAGDSVQSLARPMLCATPGAPGCADGDGGVWALLPAVPMDGCAVVVGAFDVATTWRSGGSTTASDAVCAAANPRAPCFDEVLAAAQMAEWRLAPSWWEASGRLLMPEVSAMGFSASSAPGGGELSSAVEESGGGGGPLSVAIAGGNTNTSDEADDDGLPARRAAFLAAGSRLMHLYTSEVLLRSAIMQHYRGVPTEAARELLERSAELSRPREVPVQAQPPPVAAGRPHVQVSSALPLRVAAAGSPFARSSCRPVASMRMSVRAGLPASEGPSDSASVFLGDLEASIRGAAASILDPRDARAATAAINPLANIYSKLNTQSRQDDVHSPHRGATAANPPGPVVKFSTPTWALQSSTVMQSEGAGLASMATDERQSGLPAESISTDPFTRPAPRGGFVKLGAGASDFVTDESMTFLSATQGQSSARPTPAMVAMKMKDARKPSFLLPEEPKEVEGAAVDEVEGTQPQAAADREKISSASPNFSIGSGSQDESGGEAEVKDATAAAAAAAVLTNTGGSGTKSSGDAAASAFEVQSSSTGTQTTTGTSGVTGSSSLSSTTSSSEESTESETASESDEEDDPVQDAARGGSDDAAAAQTRTDRHPHRPPAPPLPTAVRDRSDGTLLGHDVASGGCSGTIIDTMTTQPFSLNQSQMVLSPTARLEWAPPAGAAGRVVNDSIVDTMDTRPLSPGVDSMSRSAPSAVAVAAPRPVIASATNAEEGASNGDENYEDEDMSSSGGDDHAKDNEPAPGAEDASVEVKAREAAAEVPASASPMPVVTGAMNAGGDEDDYIDEDMSSSAGDNDNDNDAEPHTQGAPAEGKSEEAVSTAARGATAAAAPPAPAPPLKPVVTGTMNAGDDDENYEDETMSSSADDDDGGGGGRATAAAEVGVAAHAGDVEVVASAQPPAAALSKPMVAGAINGGGDDDHEDEDMSTSARSEGAPNHKEGRSVAQTAVGAVDAPAETTTARHTPKAVVTGAMNAADDEYDDEDMTSSEDDADGVAGPAAAAGYTGDAASTVKRMSIPFAMAEEELGRETDVSAATPFTDDGMVDPGRGGRAVPEGVAMPGADDGAARATKVMSTVAAAADDEYGSEDMSSSEGAGAGGVARSPKHHASDGAALGKAVADANHGARPYEAPDTPHDVTPPPPPLGLPTVSESGSGQFDGGDEASRSSLPSTRSMATTTTKETLSNKRKKSVKKKTTKKKVKKRVKKKANSVGGGGVSAVASSGMMAGADGDDDSSSSESGELEVGGAAVKNEKHEARSDQPALTPAAPLTANAPAASSAITTDLAPSISKPVVTGGMMAGVGDGDGGTDDPHGERAEAVAVADAKVDAVTPTIPSAPVAAGTGAAPAAARRAPELSRGRPVVSGGMMMGADDDGDSASSSAEGGRDGGPAGDDDDDDAMAITIDDFVPSPKKAEARPPPQNTAPSTANPAPPAPTSRPVVTGGMMAGGDDDTSSDGGSVEVEMKAAPPAGAAARDDGGYSDGDFSDVE